jgi:parallel beta-helix repeat protein
MQQSEAPNKTTIPFSNTGGKNTIPVTSQIGIKDGAASYEDGFPPLTRTALASGGVPPSGLDMNGILNELSERLRWSQIGGAYLFDAAYAAEIGGYPVGTKLLMSDLSGFWISTANNNTTDPDGVSSANWKAEYFVKDIVSPKDFGAVGDGVTDDTTAIQNAINASYGKTLYIPVGNYKVNSNDVYLSVTDNIRIIAEGAVFLSQTCPSIKVDSSEYLELTGLTIDVDAAATTNPGYTQPFPLFVTGLTDRVIINNVTVNNSKSGAIAIYGSSNLELSGCTTYRSGDNGIYIFGCSNGLVQGCTVREDGVVSAYTRGIIAQQSSNIRFIGNAVYDSVASITGMGIQLMGCTGSVASNNSITNCKIGISFQPTEDAGTANVAAADADLYLYNGVYTRNSIISDNTIYNCTTGIAGLQGSVGATNGKLNYGINTICNNIVVDSSFGIDIIGSEITVQDNYVKYCQNAGLRVRDDCSNIKLVRNVLNQCNIANVGFRPLYFDDSTTNSGLYLQSNATDINTNLAYVITRGSNVTCVNQLQDGLMSDYDVSAWLLTINGSNVVTATNIKDPSQTATVSYVATDLINISALTPDSEDQTFISAVFTAQTGLNVNPARGMVYNNSGTRYLAMVDGSAKVELKNNTILALFINR